jgi:signal transduction histidine kinase
MSATSIRRGRFSGLGLQRRIMLYVTVGLSAMFGVLAFLGLGAINEATELVFSERLAAAHTTASVLQHDFERVEDEALEEAAELHLLTAADLPSAEGAATSLLAHFSERDPSPFFRVSGVWVLDSAGRSIEAAGSPPAKPERDQVGTISPVLIVPPSQTTVLRALGPVAGATPLAAIVVRGGGAIDPSGRVLVVHTISVNSTAAYVPSLLGRPTSVDQPGQAPASSADEYHLEVIDPDGVTVLGIGADERPGEPSRHSEAIRDLVRDHLAAALMHEPGPGDPFEAHVMAVVPVSSTPFYLVLEQPVDIALALPLQLRERLLLSIVVGFGATLLVAWVTTRHVVKPTEQLTAAAERMAKGDLSSPITVTAPDEVGKLAESLDLMRQHLRDAHAAAAATNRELESRVAERTARLGEVLRKTISAQEEERHRLARELHDETAQTLAALAITLDRARDSLDDGSEPARGHVREAKAIATRLLDETRRLILGLRPAVLDDLGLVPAVRWQCETALSDRGIEARIEDGLGATRLPGYVEVALFRIIQEAVGNVARHADAAHVQIQLTREDGTVTVVVADDGKGFDVKVAMGTSGRARSVGLLGMQERVALLNGTMEVRSAPGSGTTLVVRIRPGEIPT